jgi:hypothetical protein
MDAVYLCWQFYGGRGLGIATHHARHLQERLARDGIEGLAEVVHPAPGVSVARCRVARADADALIAALRPHAVEPVSEAP